MVVIITGCKVAIAVSQLTFLSECPSCQNVRLHFLLIATQYSGLLPSYLLC